MTAEPWIYLEFSCDIGLLLEPRAGYYRPGVLGDKNVNFRLSLYIFDLGRFASVLIYEVLY